MHTKVQAYHSLGAGAVRNGPTFADLRGGTVQSDLNAAFDLLNLIDIECLGRRTVDYCSSSDVEPGAVTLAHDSGAREQTAGERTWLMATGAEVVKCVQTVCSSAAQSGPWVDFSECRCVLDDNCL